MLDADHVLWPTAVHVASAESTWPVAESERMNELEQTMYDWLMDSGVLGREEALRHLATMRDIDYNLERFQRKAKWFIPLVLAYIAALAWFVLAWR